MLASPREESTGRGPIPSDVTCSPAGVRDVIDGTRALVLMEDGGSPGCNSSQFSSCGDESARENGFLIGQRHAPRVRMTNRDENY